MATAETKIFSVAVSQVDNHNYDDDGDDNDYDDDDGDNNDNGHDDNRLSGQGGELLKYDAQRCHEGWLAQEKKENQLNIQLFPKDVERQPVNRPVTLLPSSRPEIQSGERPEITPSDEEFKPVQRDVEGWFERLNFALLLKLVSLSRCPWLC